MTQQHERELNMKEENIESLKQELDKAKQFEAKLIEREVRLKEDLGNSKASEVRAMELLSESGKRIRELEEEIMRAKLSETKMFDSMVSQTTQLEKTKIDLKESKLEVSALHEKIEKLDFTKDAFESLRSELQLAKESEKVALLTAKSLLEEMNSLKIELKMAIEAEEKSNEAMNDLALALKEVAIEANQAKEKLSSTELELENVKHEAGRLKTMVRSTDDGHQKLFEEVMKENEVYKNTIERLRLEAEESLLAWNEKEIGFVNCIRAAEDERAIAREENVRLIESLTASKEENSKLRDILKQALNEANIANEAAEIARVENSQLKDSIVEKDEALDFFARENERLRINEVAANECIEEMKRLLSVALAESKTRSALVEETERGENPRKAVSLDLSELKIPNGHEDESEKLVGADEALRGSIFDTVDLPMLEPGTPLHRRVSSSFVDGEETINSVVRFEDAKNNDNSQRKRRALLHRFGDLLKRKNLH
ncbi:putative WEB family protein At1g65010, chloroplastic [Actinidia eriantha]|uniref:putative WEB family protein At1g65010, chloroplastic n=1 Tax=Actinidia eriantha TaxID=165200 RepID=UPI00258845F5|nr:putative WEB family protein At1g65010, chloroplastic [Actinidia eriantha]XP_057501451.1 putative WEB family protein At1g65010, chloroplastic [Actinidia eriantha]